MKKKNKPFGIISSGEVKFTPFEKTFHRKRVTIEHFFYIGKTEYVLKIIKT